MGDGWIALLFTGESVLVVLLVFGGGMPENWFAFENGVKLLFGGEFLIS